MFSYSGSHPAQRPSVGSVVYHLLFISAPSTFSHLHPLPTTPSPSVLNKQSSSGENVLPQGLSGKEYTYLLRQETQETLVRSLGLEDPLEEGMATHSSVLAWRTSQTEEPGGLRSMGGRVSLD